MDTHHKLKLGTSIGDRSRDIERTLAHDPEALLRDAPSALGCVTPSPKGLAMPTMNHTTQRTVVCMYDGFGMDYFEASRLPVMQRMAREGLAKPGRAIFPTLTNANNISICCGAWPAEHGVTTNCYFDETTGTARFLEDASFILAPTIFQRFRQNGVRSALLTCKAKTLMLLGRHADFAVAAEEPTTRSHRKIRPAASHV